MANRWDSNPRVLVQGVTGREARFWTERMVASGTNVVAGVTPGKGGQDVNGIPVYDTVAAAKKAQAVETTVLFVPPQAARQAALEAIEAGLHTVVLLTEHVPIHDTMEILAESDAHDVTIVGPNSPGIAFPERYFLGILPLWETTIFRRGSVGVVSRSGSLGTLACSELVRHGLGQSGFIGIGGDAILGTTFYDALSTFENDPGTDVCVLVGEIGGTLEEDAAPFIEHMSKPVFAFIAGASAPDGKRMGHAGAIVEGAKGTARSKIEALRKYGARVAEVPSQLAEMVIEHS